MVGAMHFGSGTNAVTILPETSEVAHRLNQKCAFRCLGQSQPVTGIPQVLESETPKGLQQQVNPHPHILWRRKLRPRIRKPVNIRAGLTTSFLTLVLVLPHFHLPLNIIIIKIFVILMVNPEPLCWVSHCAGIVTFAILIHAIRQIVFVHFVDKETKAPRDKTHAQLYKK